MVTTDKHTCVFLNTCYEQFLLHVYQNNPALLTADYQTQLHAINGTFFGDSDFYSTGVSAVGMNAHDFIINCAPLQQAWAREHGSSLSGAPLVLEQIRSVKPDVVYIQDMAGSSRDFLLQLKEMGILVVGQIACEMSESLPAELYDIIFTSFPHYVDAFRQRGITSYYRSLAFDPRILQKIGNRDFRNRDISCSFIGGISSAHHKGTVLLETLARALPLSIWGYGVEQVAADSPIRARHQGQAWGEGMFALFGRSRITINRHSEAALYNANNMRLFEATGCGSLLITDYKDNLNQLFDIGKEIIAYRTTEECIALCKYYLNHPDEAQKIARAGQERTLKDHTYLQRMTETAEILERHLSYRRRSIPVPAKNAVSNNFRDLTPDEIPSTLLEGWKEESVAHSQRGLVQQELASMFRGQLALPFEAASLLFKSILKTPIKMLEIGCSSGYYFEVLEYLLKKKIDYTGVDYSPAMINLAKEYYPRGKFLVADGAHLPFVDRSFDTVLSGCVLIHCPNYKEHILETCRVANNYVLLHRTPISLKGKTRFFEKEAYGIKTVELWFDEQEILSLLDKSGFALSQWIEFERDNALEFSCTSYLFSRKQYD